MGLAIFSRLPKSNWRKRNGDDDDDDDDDDDVDNDNGGDERGFNEMSKKFGKVQHRRFRQRATPPEITQEMIMGSSRMEMIKKPCQRNFQAGGRVRRRGSKKGSLTFGQLAFDQQTISDSQLA